LYIYYTQNHQNIQVLKANYCIFSLLCQEKYANTSSSRKKQAKLIACLLRYYANLFLLLPNKKTKIPNDISVALAIMIIIADLLSPVV